VYNAFFAKKIINNLLRDTARVRGLGVQTGRDAAF